MIKKNQGIIVFLKKIKDNDIYIRVLTKDDELVSGMVCIGVLHNICQICP